MDQIVRELIEAIGAEPPVTEDAVQAMLADLQTELPPDYLEFLRASNGIEGDAGAGYLVLWPAEEVAEANTDYSVEEFAPGLVLIGGNGGNSAYGIDTRERDASMTYIETDFVGMGWDAIFFRGNSLGDLMRHVMNP